LLSVFMGGGANRFPDLEVGPSQPIKIVRPPLHHRHSFVPVLAACICCTDVVALNVPQLTLNGIGMPSAALIKEA
jgi:hypothetical protein